MLPSKSPSDAITGDSAVGVHAESVAEPRWKRITGMTLLAASLAIAAIAIAHSDESKGPTRELTPYPDACEYFAMGRAIQQGTYPSINIGGEQLPSRYQPGYALAMQPWLHVLPPQELVAAPIRVSQCAGLATILVMFSCLRCRGMTLAAGLCALLVVTMPWCATYARAPLSDCLSAAFIAAACAAAFQGNSKNSAFTRPRRCPARSRRDDPAAERDARTAPARHASAADAVIRIAPADRPAVGGSGHRVRRNSDADAGPE